MSVTYINPENHMAPAGQYSHAAIVTGGRLGFIAGQVALDDDGAVVGGSDAGAQFEQCLVNLVRVIEGIGAKPSQIAELRTFVVGNENLAAFRPGRERAYREHFPDGKYPPNTLVVVGGLALPELKVEISATVGLDG